MKTIKEIYSFPVIKKIKKQVEEQTENGKLIKEVEEDETFTIVFKSPTRSERDEADYEYAKEYGKCIRAGIVPRGLVEKLYDEKGGVLSEDFTNKIQELSKIFWRNQNEFSLLQTKEDKTSEDNDRIAELASQIVLVKDELQKLESARNNLFQHTAETKAQQKAIFWYVLHLTYIKDGDKVPEPFFKGKTLEEKLQYFDELTEKEQEFDAQVIDKMSFFVTLYYLGRISTKEDFTQIEKDLSPSIVTKEEDKQKSE